MLLKNYKLYFKSYFNKFLILVKVFIIIVKETLNKSQLKFIYTSCLYIFRRFAQKNPRNASAFLRFFEQTDEKSDGTICANNLISISFRKVVAIYSKFNTHGS